MWKCPHLLCHDLLDVVYSSKMMTFEVEFEFREKEEVTRNQANMVAAEPLFGKKFIRGDGSVTEHCRDAASKCPQSLAGHDEPFF